MKNIKNISRKLTALILVTAIAVTGSSIDFAADSIYAAQRQEQKTPDKQTKQKVTKIRELTDERTENSNTYLMSDGTKKLEIYGENIRYKDKGVWQDYDSTLAKTELTDENRLKRINKAVKTGKAAEAEEYRYVNRRGDSRQYFAETFDEEHPVVMNKDGHTIRFAPVDKNEKSSILSGAGTEEKAEAEVLEKTDINNEEPDKIVYADKEQKTEYAYTSLNNGVKEEIILNEKPENNVFEFKYDIPGMEADECDGNLIVLADTETGEAVAVISAPYVTDIKGTISYDDVHMYIEKSEEETYILTLTVDEEYLKDESRYPVTVDPTVTWNTNLLYYSDDNPYMTSGAPGTYTFYVGMDDEGYEKITFLGCANIIKNLKGKNIKRAAFESVVKSVDGSVKINIKNAETPCGIIALLNGVKPVLSEETYGTYDCTGYMDGDELSMDMTGIVRKIATGGMESEGIALKAENPQESRCAYFYGYETEHKAVFYIDYSETTDVEAKYDGSFNISGEYEEDGKILLSWEEYENTDVYQIYARENEGNFTPVGISEGTSYTYTLSENTEQVDFRVLAIRENEEGIVNSEDDILSDIISFEKSEDTVTDDSGTETTTISYNQTTSDTDEDGLEDGYEIWDFKTLWNTVERYDGSNPIYKVDSDGDGFPDSYEVFTLGTDPAVKNEDGKDSDGDGLTDFEEYQKGTDPWLKDSDFDNVKDSEDGTPRQTNNYTRQTVASASGVHKGLYDREYSETEDGVTVTYIANIYRGDIKSIYYDYGDPNINKKMKYFYDEKGNNTAVIEEYDDEYYSINGLQNSQTICITYTYNSQGNVTFICDQTTKYTMDYNEDGEMTDLYVGEQKLINYAYQNIEDNTSDGDDSEISIGTIISRNGNTITYGNNQTVKTVTTVKKVAEDDTASPATIVETCYGNDTELSYKTEYNIEGNIIKLTDYTADSEQPVEYEYSYSDTVTKVKRNDGFTKEVITTEDEEAGKTTVRTRYTFKDVKGEQKDYISEITSDSDIDENASQITADTTLFNGDELKNIYNTQDDVNINSLYSKLYNKEILKTTATVHDSRNTSYDIDIYAEDKNIEYTYDAAGNITQIKINGENAYEYSYDAHGRLTGEKDFINNTGGKYGYDETGNMQSKKTGPLDEAGNIIGSEAKTEYSSYKNIQWPDQLTSFGGKQITYDNAGNPLTYINGESFTWTRGRQLSKIKTADENEMNFRYNENGLRTYKETKDTVTEYTWDESRLIREQVKYKATDRKYDIWYFYDNTGNAAGFEYSYIGDTDQKQKNRIYYEKNLQGDVIGLLDSRGAEIAKYSYDAWGNIVNSLCYEGSETPYALNHITYRSYYQDSETGFYYLQSRYYDPVVCRFINADDVDTLSIELCSIFEDNLYIYCNNNPVNNIDPTGYIAQAIIGAATGILVSALLYYVEYRLGMRKWSWWSFSLIVALNATLGAVITSSVGSKFTDLLKLSSKATSKFGVTGIALKYLRFLSMGIKFFINSIVKSLTRKPGETWYKAVRRWLGI